MEYDSPNHTWGVCVVSFRHAHVNQLVRWVGGYPLVVVRCLLKVVGVILVRNTHSNLCGVRQPRTDLFLETMFLKFLTATYYKKLLVAYR
jgi:hypothetical protein